MFAVALLSASGKIFGATNTVTFSLQDIISSDYTNRVLSLWPKWPPLVDNGRIVVGVPRRATSDVSGVIIFTNLSPGTYIATVEGDSRSIPATVWTNTIPTNQGALNAVDYISTLSTNGGLVAYSQTAADARFVSVAGTNALLTTNNGRVSLNVTVSGGSSTTNFGQLVISNAPLLLTNAVRLTELSNASNALLSVAIASSNGAVAYGSNTVNTASNALVTVITNGDAAISLQSSNRILAASNQLANYLPLAGGTMAGNINMQGVTLDVKGGGTIDLYNPLDNGQAMRINSLNSGGFSNSIYITGIIGIGGGIIIRTNGSVFPNNSSAAGFLGDNTTPYGGISTFTGSTLRGTNSFDNSTNQYGVWSNLYTVSVSNSVNTNTPAVIVDTMPSQGTNAALIVRRGSTNQFLIAGNGSTFVPVAATNSIGHGADLDSAISLASGRVVMRRTGGAATNHGIGSFQEFIIGAGALNGPAGSDTYIIVGQGSQATLGTILIHSNLQFRSPGGIISPYGLTTNALALNTVMTNNARRGEYKQIVQLDATLSAAHAELWVSNSGAWRLVDSASNSAIGSIIVSLSGRINSNNHFYVTNRANATAIKGELNND
jgi:hypothetical protein